MMLRVLCEAGGSVEALALKRQALDKLGWCASRETSTSFSTNVSR